MAIIENIWQGKYYVYVRNVQSKSNVCVPMHKLVVSY